LGCQLLDSGVDRVAVGDDHGDKLAGQFGRGRVALELGEMALENGGSRALAEVGLEHRGERQPPPGSFRSNEVRALHGAVAR